ncbi:MAG: glycosyltransferase family 87 protein [Rhodocyclaceae bacterium]
MPSSHGVSCGKRRVRPGHESPLPLNLQHRDPGSPPAPKAHWLNRERFVAYPRIVLALFVIIGGAWVALSKDLVDPVGKPLGYDFIAYWAASHLALAGQPQDAYNLQVLLEAERAAVPANTTIFPWYYPPTFYLVVLPLALLPYLAAYFTFVLTTFAAYFATFRRVVTGREATVCLIAFPGLWINFAHGQNGFLTAALAAAALLCLQSRPYWSGVLIGLLAIKPHLAILFPIALIACGAWRTFAVAGLVATLFLAVGTFVFGQATLTAFFGSLWMPRAIVETLGSHLWLKMPTPIAMAQMLGMPPLPARLLHAAVACGAIWAVWRVWRGCHTASLRSAALMVATFLVTPYAFDYDLAWLAFPIAWMALAGLRNGWLPGEREVLVAAWLLPLVMAPIGKLVPVQVAPAILAMFLWAIARRARHGPSREPHR